MKKMCLAMLIVGIILMGIVLLGKYQVYMIGKFALGFSVAFITSAILNLSKKN